MNPDSSSYRVVESDGDVKESNHDGKESNHDGKESDCDGNIKEVEEITCCQKIKNFIIKNYLPISLLFAVVFGAFVPQPGVAVSHKATQYICIIGIFLYSGLYLRTSSIKEALKAYKAALWGIISILGVTCVIGGQLTMLLNFDDINLHQFKNKTISNMTQAPNITVSNINTSSTINDNSKTYSLGPGEFKSALLVYFSMPCTVSSGVVMVTQLNGSFALALLLTVFANIVGIFTMPLFLQWMLTSVASIQIDIRTLLLKLSLTLLLPLIIGKSLRYVKKIKDFVVVPGHKRILKLINVTLLAIIIWMKVSKSSQDGGLSKLKFVSVVFIIGWALAMHILFIIMNTIASFLLKLKLDQKKCIIILASQKTLAVAIPIIGFLPSDLGDQGLMAIALSICHISIIFFYAVLIPLWLMVEKKRQKKCIEKEEVELAFI